MKFYKLGVFTLLFIFPSLLLAERPSLTSLQLQVNDLQTQLGALQNQVETIPAAGEPVYSYVGKTTTQFFGDAGLKELTAACNQQYTGSRMCKSDEYMNTVTFPGTEATGYSWIRPLLTEILYTYQLLYIDSSGYSQNQPMSCGTWSQAASSLYGLTVNENGHMWTRPCNSQLSVACCRQVN